MKRGARQRCMWRWKGCWETEGHPHELLQCYRQCMFRARQSHAFAINRQTMCVK